MLVKRSSNLTSSRLLAKNAIWNLGGNVAAIAIALLSVPILLRYLGTDRLGIISLIWIVEGQFGIFDLGLSFALTKLVSEKLGVLKEDETPPLFWITLLIMSVIGTFGSFVFWNLSPWLVTSALKIPQAIQQEALTAFHLVAISLPVVLSSAALRGVLAAHQRFDLLNLTRAPLSLFSYFVPLLVLPFSKTLGPFVGVLVLSRFIGWAVYFLLCLRVSPILGRNVTTQGAPLRHMFRFGGWMTITNIVGPLMVNLDRILIGTIISMAAVAYYATPYEAATRLWIIPSSLTGVLFPALSATLLTDRTRAALLYETVVKYIFLSLFPITLIVLSLGRWGLLLWLGPVFSQNSTTILQLLTLGVFLNSLAQVPFWQIQASGRPDLAAKVHLIELPFYLLTFWYLTKYYGIVGAGIAWLLRTGIDSVIMFSISVRLLPECKSAIRKLLFVTISVAPIFIIATLFASYETAGLFALIVCGIFLVFSWLFLLSPKERGFAKNPLTLLLNRQ